VSEPIYLIIKIMHCLGATVHHTTTLNNCTWLSGPIYVWLADFEHCHWFLMHAQDGTTPLYIAAQESKLEVVRALLDGGANVNQAHKV